MHALAARLGAPHALAVAAARRAIDERREALLAGDPHDGADLESRDVAELESRATALLAALEQPSLHRVLNATGVIVHTNLGRAPLPAAALAAVARAGDGYCNLELDLATGDRGSRDAHVRSLLCELTGAQAAFAVNNGAAAVLLAVAALAGPGRAIVVSRGQLVEIGGGFRIPEVIAQSGAQLIEVGTTNRTRLSDYEQALAGAGAQVGAILRVHPSNFRALGFVQDVSIEDLCRLGTPVIDDVGSGVLADARGISVPADARGIPVPADARGIPALADEPSIRRSVAAGAALVCCSGDKLLGGPQAGLLVGRLEAVGSARRHPLARALRIDKLSLAALEATVRLYRDPARAAREIPVLAMLQASEETLASRARRLCDGLAPSAVLVRSFSRSGGGALPLLELEGPAVQLRTGHDPVLLARSLRGGEPPLVARIKDGCVLLDPRTLSDAEIPPAIEAVGAAIDELARR